MRTPLELGSILQGRYKILSIAGERGAGFVYKVTGLILDREFALKEMFVDTQNPEEIAKISHIFQNEAETLARLNHPGIPKIYDAFFEEEKYYLVMDFIPGATLEKLLNENPQYFFEASVLEWLEQIMEILDYLHNLENPVIVRDLKPSNIMLTPEGIIKIIDFGIAKIFNSGGNTRQVVRGRGSNGFAPPEQYESDDVDARCDIYSLGVTLYCLLTKRIIPDSLDRIKSHQKLNPPSYYNPLVSSGVDAMILNMVELRPQDRFQSVAEVREFMNRNGLRSGAKKVMMDDSNLPSTKQRLDTSGILGRSGANSPATTRTDLTVSPKIGSGSVPPSMICVKCGAQLLHDDMFCSNCGEKVHPAAIAGAGVHTTDISSTSSKISPTVPRPGPLPASRYGRPAHSPALSPPQQESVIWKKPSFLVITGIIAVIIIIIGLLLFFHKGDGIEKNTITPSPSPTDAEYYISHGNKKFDEKDYKGAIEYFNQVILLKPDNYNAYYKRGVSRCNLEDYDRAMEDFNMAIRLKGDSEEAYNGRGLAYYGKEDYDRAIKDFTKVIELNPDAYWAYDNRALVYIDKKEYTKALNDLSKALDINPDDPDAYFNRGVLYFNKGNYDKAIENFNQSIDLDPRADAYQKRGEVHYKHGENEKAMRDFERAIELDQTFARAYYYRGKVYFDRKEYKKADADWKKAVELDPDGPDGKDAKESLKKL